VQANHRSLRVETASPERPEQVEFTFDGRTLLGVPGEAIAAALFASGIRVFRTMPKYGGARGGFCFIGRCSDCQMIVNGVLNTAVCVTPLVAGMAIETQHGLGHWPESEAAS